MPETAVGLHRRIAAVADVVLELLIELRSAIGHCRVTVVNRRQHFVIDFDQLDGFVGDRLRVCRDECDGVADVADMLVQKRLLRRPTEHRVQVDVVEVLVSEDSADTGKRLSLVHADILDDRMGIRALLDATVDHAGHAVVVGEDRASGDDVLGVLARAVLSDELIILRIHLQREVAFACLLVRLLGNRIVLTIQQRLSHYSPPFAIAASTALNT